MQLLPLTVEAMMEEGDREEDIYYTILLYSLKIRVAVLYSSTLSAAYTSLAQSVQPFILYFKEHYMQPLGGKNIGHFCMEFTLLLKYIPCITIIELHRTG